MTFKKYKQNLHRENNKIIAYNTHIATIKGDYLILEDWEIKRIWKGKEETINTSPTTTKYINYVADELNLTISSDLGMQRSEIEKNWSIDEETEGYYLKDY
tara:strand:- start:3988 stop:4290 length:303 start_codon:yes stop_codon:yes gene_type:complete